MQTRLLCMACNMQPLIAELLIPAPGQNRPPALQSIPSLPTLPSTSRLS